MDFRLLGPLEVWHDGVCLPITAPQQRAVLASLLTRLGTAVSIDTILDDLWGAASPKTAVMTVRNYIRRLRGVLPEPVLESTTAGYRLSARPDQVDLHRFTTLVEQAGERESTELFDQALALWRGQPLMNVGDVPLRFVQAPRWEETYLAAVENSMDLRLRRGQHGEVVAGLIELTNRYPLRERLCRQLMLALYRGGRAADALTHYRRIRTTLISELGMEPSPELRQLEAAILREDGRLLTTETSETEPDERLGRAHAPAQLPPLPTFFLGREDEIAELVDQLTAPDNTRCFVYGQGGCGKSALAVRVGHELAGRHPDGQLYVDLGGSTPGVPTRSPVEVLALLIHGLGGADYDHTADLDTLVRAYRTRLRGRRVLIILDNAATAEQVRPALSDEPGCTVIVTSRAAITKRDSVFHLDTLREPHAVELLGRIAGVRKVAAESGAAARIAELCGRLPLALRLIATRAALRPHWPLDSWVQLLDDERARLDLLRHEDIDVRASIQIGLDGLATSDDPADRDAAALFPLLGILDVPHVTPALAAGLIGWPVARAELALEALLGTQMVLSPGPGRYVLFDLIALLAKEKAAGLTAGERREPLSRAVDWYVAAIRSCSLTATGARTDYGLPQDHPTDGLVTVHFDRYEDVRTWLDRELAVLVAVFRQAVAAGVPGSVDATRHALLTLPFYFNSAMPWTERVALASMLLEHDPSSAALAYTNLAIVEGQRTNFAAAQQFLDKAGHHLDESDTYTWMMHESTRGIVEVYQGAFEVALRRFQRILRTASRSGYRTRASMVLSNLGDTYTRLGRAAEALPLIEQAVAISREIGHQVNLAVHLNTMLQAYSALDEHHQVIRRAPEVLAQHELLGNAHQRAEHLLTMAKSLRALGDEAAAEEHVASARDCLAEIGTRERMQAGALFDHLITDVP